MQIKICLSKDEAQRSSSSYLELLHNFPLSSNTMPLFLLVFLLRRGSSGAALGFYLGIGAFQMEGLFRGREHPSPWRVPAEASCPLLGGIAHFWEVLLTSGECCLLLRGIAYFWGVLPTSWGCCLLLGDAAHSWEVLTTCGGVLEWS